MVSPAELEGRREEGTRHLWTNKPILHPRNTSPQPSLQTLTLPSHQFNTRPAWGMDLGVQKDSKVRDPRGYPARSFHVFTSYLKLLDFILSTWCLCSGSLLCFRHALSQFKVRLSTLVFMDQLVALVVKNPLPMQVDVRDTGSIPESGRCPGGGHGNPLQYSCLENPMDRGAWQATVHRAAQGQT